MSTAMAQEFETFWREFPRRIGKLAAMKAYEKARKLATADQILAGVKAYRQHKPKWQEWKHPGPWLNAGRYLDEYETTPTAPVESVEDMLERTGHWSVGCKRLHGGMCESANAYYARVDADEKQTSGAA